MKNSKEEKLAAIRERKAKLAKNERKIVAKITKNKRKEDTRRKILLGSFVLSLIEKEQNASFKAQIMTGLTAYLKKPQDRALFNLSPLPEASEGQ